MPTKRRKAHASASDTDEPGGHGKPPTRDPLAENIARNLAHLAGLLRYYLCRIGKRASVGLDGAYKLEMAALTP